MGQKTNPNIFRLGINKKWKTEFFEKKQRELPLYTFKDLEIKSYIGRFLETKGLILHDYKQHYNDSTLYLYISYFVSSDFVRNKDTKTERITLLSSSKQKDISKVAKHVNNKYFYFSTANKSIKNKMNLKNKTSKNLYRLRKYFNANPAISSLNTDDMTFSDFNRHSVLIKTSTVFDNMFTVLNLFTNNKYNIVINFCCINKDLHFLKSTQKKNFILLQKFKNSQFLKEGIELIFHVVYNKSSANLLAKFIALQLKKVKRHKFFLTFLKQSLSILSTSEFSKIKGVKIIVKGRLNGVPRARHQIITINDVPAQSLMTNLDYAQTTTHNSNGSYGIKVWIIEKD